MRRTRALIAACGLLAVGAGLARACFPGASWQLLDKRSDTLRQAPVNSFAWEAVRLAAPSAWHHASPAAVGDGQPPPDPRAAVERAGLSAAQLSALAAMRAAPDSRWALSAAGALPPAIRLYTGGAVAFAHNNLADAQEYFRFVLALPPAQAAPRVVWAQYMLGRIAAKSGSPADAEAAYAKVRDLVAHGAPDPLDLARGSLGEQARLLLERNDLPGAVALYAEQAADGSAEAVQSLRMVAERAMAHPDGLPTLVRDPLAQRLLVVYALGLTGDYLHRQATGHTAEDIGVDGFWEPDNLDTRPLAALLAAVRATGTPPPAALDRLAALAYRLGDTGAAHDLAAKSKTPLALWIRAKLALETGQDAAPLFAAALRAAQAEAGQTALEPSSVGLLRGETAVATLDAGDFVQAADVLWPVAGTYWGDFAYLAERVLTADELLAFVHAHAAEPEPAAAAGQAPLPAGPVGNLRALLARRLMREGRVDDALPFFDTENNPGSDTGQDGTGGRDARADAVALRDAQRQARGALWPDSRARAGWQAAVLLRTRGMELMGTEGSPDQAFVGGEFEEWLSPGPAGPFADPQSGATQAERVRYDRSRPLPDLRFHYRYLAIDAALASARDLPGRSQAYAAVLCRAAGWSLGVHDDARAEAIWRQYAAHGARVAFATHFGRGCPDPDFDGLWRTRGMLAEQAARHALHGRKWLAAGVGVALLGMMAVVVRRRRRTKKTFGY